MFEKLSIKNFKSISDWQELKLAPITLIYGPNSSGKSTIIQSLLLLQQTMLKPNKNGGLVTNGLNLKLGNFPVIVNKHDLNKDIEFNIDYYCIENEKGNSKYNKRFEFVYGYIGGSDEQGFSFLKNYKYFSEMNFKKKKTQHFLFLICLNDLDFAERIQSGFQIKTKVTYFHFKNECGPRRSFTH